MFQIRVVLGKGVHLAPHPTRMLTNGEIVALHPVGRNLVRGRRVMQNLCNALWRAIHDFRGDCNHPRTLTPLTDDSVEQVGGRHLKGFPWPAGLTRARRFNRVSIHIQQGVRIVRQVVTGKQWNVRKVVLRLSSLFFRHWMNCLPSVSVRLPATHAGTILLSGAKATQIHVSPK